VQTQVSIKMNGVTLGANEDGTPNDEAMRELSTQAFMSMSVEERDSFFTSVLTSVFAKAQHLVPVKTGALKASAKMLKVGIAHIIEYPLSYAGYVHEIMYRNHVSPTQAKFLHDAFVQTMQELMSSYGEVNLPSFAVKLEIQPVLRLLLSDSVALHFKGARSWRGYMGIL
jgi:hypothetical protein